MNKIRILLYGREDWRLRYNIPEHVQLVCQPAVSEVPKKAYDLVILDATPAEFELMLLYKAVSAYRLFVTSRVDRDQCGWFISSKMGRELRNADIQRFLTEDTKWFFSYSYGEKMSPNTIDISRNFTGSVQWKGGNAVCLEGDFGADYTQALYWRYNLPMEKDLTLDFWLEYEKTPGVSLKLCATMFAYASISSVIQSWEFDESELADVVRLTPKDKGSLFLELQVKGTGSLSVVALHDRHSRGPYGHFIPGGKRYVTSKKEEIFCYFNPGDWKPPMCVYFSGYKTREGFEGFNMMQNMGSPFLLISEARVKGGAFYMGSEEYENLMTSILKEHLDKLGFTSHQMILSGISMGSTGALYYGCELPPHAIIVGKPLANIGTIAENEKRNRPGGFPTSLDILMYHTGSTAPEQIPELNRRFWKKLESTDWSGTTFIVSHMLEDDYDAEAYDNLVSALSRSNVSIYGRGLHGRHNDNTTGIVQWFVSQYRKVFREDFGEFAGPFRQGD